MDSFGDGGLGWHSFMDADVALFSYGRHFETTFFQDPISSCVTSIFLFQSPLSSSIDLIPPLHIIMTSSVK